MGTAADSGPAPGGPGPDGDLDWLVVRGRGRSASRVLDVAARSLDTARAFSAFTPRVVVATTAASMQGAASPATAASAHALHLIAADALELPFRDGAFGVVTCRSTAHCFRELLPALRQIARVLRPGGALLLAERLAHDDTDATAFMGEVERRRDPTHVRAFRPLEWTAFLRAAGLTVIDDVVLVRTRGWDDWVRSAGLDAGARRELDRYVLAAPAPHREAFHFALDGDRIVSFTEETLALRADKD